jgi:hypothetical protein
MAITSLSDSLTALQAARAVELTTANAIGHRDGCQAAMFETMKVNPSGTDLEAQANLVLGWKTEIARAEALVRVTSGS